MTMPVTSSDVLGSYLEGIETHTDKGLELAALELGSYLEGIETQVARSRFLELQEVGIVP